MILEMLAHRTPPSCIAANILTIANSLHPNCDAVKTLPCVSVVRECRSVLLVTTKTLAAYQLALVPEYLQHHSDGTERRQIKMENSIIRIATDAGFKCVTLSSCILPEDGTAESCVTAIAQAFREGRELLDNWRDVTSRMYPNRPDLLALIPSSSLLTLAKLSNKSLLMTDTCATARKFRRLFADHIRQVALNNGIPDDQIHIFQADCWQHLRNVWFGAVIKQLSLRLSEVLESDLNEISPFLRVTTEVVSLLIALEKYFAETANYAKGRGSCFYHYMITYHPNAYVYPVARATGGNRQDIGVEGALAIMNIPYYLEFLNWRLSCGGKTESILEKNLFILLQSVEVVAMLRVLSILHIAVCMPLRWLSGNCQDLAEHDFGVADMAWTVDLMEKAFTRVANNGELLLDEDFMMNIFKDISDKVPPFKEYLLFMFTEKRSNPLCSRSKDDKVLPYDLLRAMMFFPTRVDIRQSQDQSCRLAEVAACRFVVEFRDESKATAAYLNSIGGLKSRDKISIIERQANMGKDASNSISESLHASSTVGLRTCGTARLDHMAAEGQSRANNDFGRGHQALVTGRRAKSGVIVKEIGEFHKLPQELQKSIIQAGKESAGSWRKKFDEALFRQKEASRRKEQIKLEKKLTDAQEDYIVAIYFWEQYHSPRCWKTVEIAKMHFKKLNSETARLVAVKEQILIRYLGLGWVKAHHAWSSGGTTYLAKYLLGWLIETVIPMADNVDIPSEPPLSLPSPPELPSLGTISDLALVYKTASEEKIASFKEKSNKERDSREADGKGDKWSERQQSTKPDIDETFVGFKIEMLFTFPNAIDGGTYLDWCHGQVVSIRNPKTNTVNIKWAPECVGDGDKEETREKLLKTRWNPKNCEKAGAWREYLTR